MAGGKQTRAGALLLAAPLVRAVRASSLARAPEKEGLSAVRAGGDTPARRDAMATPYPDRTAGRTAGPRETGVDSGAARAEWGPRAGLPICLCPRLPAARRPARSLADAPLPRPQRIKSKAATQRSLPIRFVRTRMMTVSAFRASGLPGFVGVLREPFGPRGVARPPGGVGSLNAFHRQGAIPSSRTTPRRAPR